MTATLAANRRRTRVEPSFVLAVLGTLISSYLTVERSTASASLVCPEGAVVNCAKVTSSAYAIFLGVPVAVLGLAFFLGMTALTAPPAWRIRRLDPLRVAGVIVGVAMVLYLVWAELFRLHAICLWCTGVHVLTVALLGAVLWRVVGREPHP